MTCYCCESRKCADGVEKTPHPSVPCHSKTRKAAQAADVAPKKKKRPGVGFGNWGLFLVVIYMMRSDFAVNNDDKRSAHQVPPRELLQQSPGLIALGVLPAGTHTHCTHDRVCAARSLAHRRLRSALKGINKAELVVIHGANVCG